MKKIYSKKPKRNRRDKEELLAFIDRIRRQKAKMESRAKAKRDIVVIVLLATLANAQVYFKVYNFAFIVFAFSRTIMRI
jgi:hypothetical protein